MLVEHGINSAKWCDQASVESVTPSTSRTHQKNHSNMNHPNTNRIETPRSCSPIQVNVSPSSSKHTTPDKNTINDLLALVGNNKETSSARKRRNGVNGIGDYLSSQSTTQDQHDANTYAQYLMQAQAYNYLYNYQNAAALGWNASNQWAMQATAGVSGSNSATVTAPPPPPPPAAIPMNFWNTMSQNSDAATKESSYDKSSYDTVTKSYDSVTKESKGSGSSGSTIDKLTASMNEDVVPLVPSETSSVNTAGIYQ